MNYQRDYSSHFPSVLDLGSRQRKAVKILRALTAFLKREDLRGLVCLDLGCSVGVITDTLAQAGACVVGIDIDLGAIRQRAGGQATTASFAIGDVSAVPFPAEAFDLIVCSQVYEHAPSLESLVGEIHRTLKRGGVCFFSGPNRWAIMEDHYDLPFLSWVPKGLADRIVRLTGRGTEYYEHPLSSRSLRRALHHFAIVDWTPELLQYPDRYAMGPRAASVQPIMRRIPGWGWRVIGECVPNFNWILVKAGP